jgi:uncharacterized protein YrrD
MLWRVRELLGFAVDATDGALGRIDDVYFDGEQWVVRYLAAETGDWLAGRRVLLSPASIRRINRSHRWVAVALTRRQLCESREVDPGEETRLRHETARLEYRGRGDHRTAGGPPIETGTGHRHLSSARVVVGYSVHAADGEVGDVEDLVVDDGTWTVRYLVLDSRHWWPGRRILAAEWLGWAGRAERRVHVDIPRDTIRRAPEYDSARPIDRAYEARLYAHYGRAPRSSS